MRVLLLATLVLVACDPVSAVPSQVARSTRPAAASATPAALALTTCERDSLQVARDFVSRFNGRDLTGATALFTDDARTYWARRGDPVTDGFKEGGRVMIGTMLRLRMSDGEILAYDRIDPDPAPVVHYTEQGTAQLHLVPRFVGFRGTFPDGAVRTLGTKFVYACGQHGIAQMLILASG